MKKFLRFLLLLVVIPLITSCFVTIPYDAPIGVWKSDDPDLCLEIVSKVQMESTGTYISDGENLEVFLTFKNDPAFIVQPVYSYKHYRVNDELRYGIDSSIFYFDGEFTIEDGKMFYFARWSDLTGHGTGQDTRTIIFEKVEYDAP